MSLSHITIPPHISQSAFKTAARVAGRIAPGPAGRAAFRLFCTPPKRSTPTPGEQRLAARMAPVLAAATRDRIAFDGGTVASYTWPAATPERRGRVLLVHGWTGRALAMMAFVEPLRSAGFDVAALDLPAHGDSDGRQLNLALGAKAVAAVAAHLGGITALVTHSFGGPVSVLAAEGGLPLAGPVPVDRLVLIASPNSLAAVTHGFAARIDLPPRAVAAMDREIHRIAGRPVEAFMAGEFLARIGRPTLLIHDEGDLDVPFERAVEIAAAAPHVAVHPTTGLGHRRIIFTPSVIKTAVAFVAG